MKRIAIGFLALLLCACLLAGCQVAHLLKQVQSEKEGESTASKGGAQGERSAAESSAPGEATSKESLVMGPKPAQSEASESAQEDASEAAEPALIGDFSLSDYIGMSYEDLASMYGESEIYLWLELGLYCQFEDVKITFHFDLDMIDPYYGDATQWLLDPGEFTPGDMDSFYNFETGRFRPSDFRVSSIDVWDTNLDWLLYELGLEAPVTLEMLGDCFGQTRTIETDDMYGQVQAGRYSVGGHAYWFTFDDKGEFVTIAHIGRLWQEDALHGAEVMTVCYFGYEADTGIAWLSIPPNYNDMGGDAVAYALQLPMQRLFETEPPVEGELYLACIGEEHPNNNRRTVLQLDRIYPPAEEDLMANLMRYEEIEDQVQQGMSLLIEMDWLFIDGNLCYTAALGTDHPDHFVRERCFAVDVKNWNVYEYDVFTDSYVPLGRG